MGPFDGSDDRHAARCHLFSDGQMMSVAREIQAPLRSRTSGMLSFSPPRLGLGAALELAAISRCTSRMAESKSSCARRLISDSASIVLPEHAQGTQNRVRQTQRGQADSAMTSHRCASSAPAPGPALTQSHLLTHPTTAHVWMRRKAESLQHGRVEDVATVGHGDLGPVGGRHVGRAQLAAQHPTNGLALIIWTHEQHNRKQKRKENESRGGLERTVLVERPAAWTDLSTGRSRSVVKPD